MQSGSPHPILVIRMRFKRTCRPIGFLKRNETVLFLWTETSSMGGVVVGIPIVSLGVAVGALGGLGTVSVPVSLLGEDWIL